MADVFMYCSQSGGTRYRDEILDEAMEEDYTPAIPHRRVKETAELDITPMIDITFLLLIFFLVASTPDLKTAVDLPPARHGKGVSENSSAIITVAEGADPHSALVYLADGTEGDPLAGNPQQQAAAIEAYLRKEDKPNVLVKAARRIIYDEVSRVSAAVGRVEGIKLHWAVFEID